MMLGPRALAAWCAIIARATSYDDGDPPRVFAWTPSGRDGFGSQYFGHMAVFAACRRVPGGLGKGCCYVHNPIKALEHGVGVGSAERFTGMKTDEECSGFKSANGRSMPKNMIIPQFPRPMEIKWYFLANATVRDELRAMYDASPGKERLREHDCRYRIHVRRGDHTATANRGGLIGNGSYACLVKSILKKDPAAKVCIYSEGATEDFGELAALPVEFHLDGDPFETFHNFVTAENLFVAHSLLSGAAAVLATQANIYGVPYEPTMSQALASCWPGDCDCAGYARGGARECCGKSREARILDIMRRTDVWSLFGLDSKRIEAEIAGGDLSWAAKDPSAPVFPPWWPDPVAEAKKKREAAGLATDDPRPKRRRPALVPPGYKPPPPPEPRKPFVPEPKPEAIPTRAPTLRAWDKVPAINAHLVYYDR